MFGLNTQLEIYVACGVTDMRKAFNGLAAIVEEQLQLDTLSGALFCFCNRRRDRLKILHWDGSGLCLFCKRLEKGTFAWPSNAGESLRISSVQLQRLVSGIDLSGARERKWYRKLHRVDDLGATGTF